MLACPIPPIPTAAILSLSEGETWPKLFPRIELGAMVIPAKAAAPDFRKSRLVKFDIILHLKLLINKLR